jgi:hypothetical protein
MMSVDSVIFVIITQPATSGLSTTSFIRRINFARSTSPASSSTSKRYIGVVLRNRTNHRGTEDLRKPAYEHLERTRTASRTATSTFHRIPRCPADDDDHDRSLHLTAIQPLGPAYHRSTFHPSLRTSLLVAEIWKADGTSIGQGGFAARRALEYRKGLVGI